MKKALLILFVAAFTLLCILPTAAMLLGYEGENYENRPLARMPKLFDRNGLNLSFPEGFDDYFQDHFGFREEMVTAFHSVTETALKDTLNDDVIIGKNDFLFFSETINDYLGTNRLTDFDIERIAVVLRMQQDYITSQGMDFAFTLAPNKSTIYPEYMPDYLSPTGEQSNRERLEEALVRHGVNCIPLADELISAKDQGLLYHYHDTHWNERGAQIGYRAIMEAILPDAEYARYEGLTPATRNDHAGDLHYFLFPSEEGRMEAPDYGIAFEYTRDAAAPGRTTTIGTTSDANDYRLLLYRDSFGDAILPYLSTNLGRVLYDSEFPYNYSALAEERPNGVVIELVERNIPNLLTQAPFLPAWETSLNGSVTGTLNAEAITVSRNGSTVVCGVFEASAYAPASMRILLKTPNGCYEAFPILEKEAQHLIEDTDSICGFSLVLPDDFTGSFECTLALEQADGYLESKPFEITIKP